MSVGVVDHTTANSSTISFGTAGNELANLNITTANVSSASGSNSLVLLGKANTANLTIGTLNLGFGGAIVLANTNTAGDYAVNVGSLNGTSGTVKSSNNSTVALTATLNLTGTSTGNFSGQIINTSSNSTTRVVKSGSATQTLGGSSNYTGGTLITAGTLVVGANSAIGAASGGVAISGASQAILRFNDGISVGNTITYSSTNATSGVARLVANNAAYTVGTTGNFTSSFAGGDADTTAKILAGTNSQGSTATLTMKFSDTSAATNDAIRTSDVFSLSGTSTNAFVLQLSYTGLAAGSFLGWDNAGTWVNAVSGNTGNNASLAQQGYLGSFSAFQTTYGSTIANYIGAYGVDTTAGSAWAVLNHNSDFAVVPEPSTWLLFAGGLTFVIVMRRRRA